MSENQLLISLHHLADLVVLLHAVRDQYKEGAALLLKNHRTSSCTGWVGYDMISVCPHHLQLSLLLYYKIRFCNKKLFAGLIPYLVA